MPHQAELEVRVSCKLTSDSGIEPILIERAFAAADVDECLIVGVEKVGAGLHGRMVQGNRDLQSIARSVGEIRTIGTPGLEPALFESKPVFYCRTGPGLVQGKLLINSVFTLIAAPFTRIIKWPSVGMQVAETYQSCG